MKPFLVLLALGISGYFAYSHLKPPALTVENPGQVLATLTSASAFDAPFLAKAHGMLSDDVTSALRHRKVTVTGTLSGFQIRGVEGTDLDLELSTGSQQKIVLSTDLRRYARLESGSATQGYRFIREGNQLLLYQRSGNSLAFQKVLFTIGDTVSLGVMLERANRHKLEFHWPLQPQPKTDS